jgi:hypothetical protein
VQHTQTCMFVSHICEKELAVSCWFAHQVSIPISSNLLSNTACSAETGGCLHSARCCTPLSCVAALLLAVLLLLLLFLAACVHTVACMLQLLTDTVAVFASWKPPMAAVTLAVTVYS